MVKVSEILTKMKNHWHAPKSAIHRGAEIPFKLRCSFKPGIEENELSSLGVSPPHDLKDFLLMSDGAVLFKDDIYGQWGLEIYSLRKMIQMTDCYFKVGAADYLEGDLLVGEFIGDSDKLLIRCNLQSEDYGAVVVVSAIDPRDEWDVVAEDFGHFLNDLMLCQGDKYWEMK